MTCKATTKSAAIPYVSVVSLTVIRGTVLADTLRSLSMVLEPCGRRRSFPNIGPSLATQYSFGCRKLHYMFNDSYNVQAKRTSHPTSPPPLSSTTLVWRAASASAFPRGRVHPTHNASHPPAGRCDSHIFTLNDPCISRKHRSDADCRSRRTTYRGLRVESACGRCTGTPPSLRQNSHPHRGSDIGLCP